MSIFKTDKIIDNQIDNKIDNQIELVEKKSNIISVTYIYKATGSTSPNLNNLRFYDSGLTLNGQPIYYDETNTYQLNYGGFPWIIKRIDNTVLSTFIKFSAGVVGDYSGSGGWTGTVTISLI